MRLKKGIVGIWNVREELIESTSDVSKFKASLYPIEYSGKFKIIGYKDENSCKNFQRLAIMDKMQNREFNVLINSMYPYYCGAAMDSLEFIDLSSEIVKYSDPDFIYWTPAELNSKFEKTDLIELSKSELEEIKSWKATTFGEIIFNYWD